MRGVWSRRSRDKGQTTKFHTPGHGSIQAAGGEIVFVPAEVVPELVQIGEADFFAKGVDDYLDVLSDIVPGRTKSEKRKKAMTTLSGMVGALVLARAVDDANLAKEILVATAASLTAPTAGNA